MGKECMAWLSRRLWGGTSLKTAAKEATWVPEYREIFLSVSNEMQMPDRKLYLLDHPKNSLFTK